MTEQLTLPGFGYIAALKWPKPCAACTKTIPYDHPGFWNKENKQYCHYREDCVKKLGANSTPSNNPAGTASKTPGEAALTDAANDLALSKRIDERVEARLTKAIAIVDRRIPDAKQYECYAMIVTEVLHELWSEYAMLKIQKSKEANIKSVRP